MVTPTEQIAQQRASIEQARKQAQELAKKQEISRAQLLKRGLAEKARAKGEQIRREKIAKARLAEIAKVEEPFEKETKRYEKEKATYEAEVARVKKYNVAIETIKRAARKGMVWAHAMYGSGIVKKLAKEYVKKQKIARQRVGAQAPSEMTGIEKFQYETFRSGGYTPSEASKLTEWSMKHKATPGLEMQEKIISAPPKVSALPSFLQPGYVSPELRKILPPKIIQKFEQQQLETKRYQDFGYTSTEAQRLATASLARGGVTFSPEEARKIARVTISEKVPGALRDIGAYIGKLPEKAYREVFPKVVTAFEKAPPILEREIAPVVLGVGPIGIRAPIGVTYGEIAALPVKAVEYVAEEVGETAELGYAIATGYLPEKWKPSKYVGPIGERPITPAEVTEALETGWFEKAEKEGWYEPVTPERVGEVAEKVVEMAPYAIPYVGPTYIASEFFAGVEMVKHPEKEAEKIYKEQESYKAYVEQHTEAGKDLEPGYELEPILTETEHKAEVLPFYIEQVKQKGAIEAATSLAFLGAIGIAKAVPAIIRTTVPRQKYLGMTKSKYNIAVKEAEKKFVKFGEQDIAWAGKVEKDTGGVFIRGEQRLGELKRDIKVYGELKETELGKVFIPYGKGEIVGEGVILLGKKKIPYQYLEAQKFEVGADAISVRAGELIGHPELIKKLPSKIKLLRESKFMPGELKPEFIKVEEALRGPVRIIPEPLAKAEVYKILGKTTTVPKAGTFALYRIKPKYLTPSAKLERAIKKQMKENIYFGGEVTKEIAPQIAIQLKPKKFLVIGRKEVGVLVVKEAEREVKFGMRIVGGVKTPFAKTFAEVKVKPLLIKLPKIPKPPKPTVEIAKPTPLVEIPRMVGGLGLRVLPEPTYAPVEVEVGAMLMPPVTKLAVIPRIDVGVKPRVEVISVLRTGEKFKYETALGLKRVTIPKFKEVLVTREALRERLIPREALTLREIQIQREALRQVPIMRPSVVPRIRPPRLRIPRLRIPIVLKGPYIKRRMPKLRKPVPERGYTFEIRRKGKWQRAKLPFAFATEAGAESIAQEKVLKEAAASYKVVKAKPGKRVVRTRKKPSLYRKMLFRKAKKEKGVMVQRKKLRILTPGEKREISYAGGLARMKKSKLLFSQPKRITKKKGKKKVTKKKGGKKK